MKTCLNRTLLVLSLALGGCVGTKEALFTTKTNIGLDMDRTPPTMEFSAARRESVIEPVYDGGQTPSVIASFKLRSGFWVFADIASTFAGGDAAYIMAELWTDPSQSVTNADKSGFYVKDFPTSKKSFFRWPPFGARERPAAQTNGSSKPLMFGTDTMFGLKAAWSGLGEAPDTVKLGFSRKEMAYAPIFASKTDVGGSNLFLIKMPSFLAVLDVGTDLSLTNLLSGGTNTASGVAAAATEGASGGQPTATNTAANSKQEKIRHIQYFATGKAAELFAQRQELRRVMIQRFDFSAYNVATNDALALLGPTTTNLLATKQALTESTNTLASITTNFLVVSNRLAAATNSLAQVEAKKKELEKDLLVATTAAGETKADLQKKNADLQKQIKLLGEAEARLQLFSRPVALVATSDNQVEAYLKSALTNQAVTAQEANLIRAASSPKEKLDRLAEALHKADPNKFKAFKDEIGRPQQ